MRVLGFAGCKRAGKDSAAKFVLGHVLYENMIINKFGMNDKGELIVNSGYYDDKGQLVEGMGLFELNRLDPEFIYYLQEQIWPHVKVYNFADSLKWICMNIYGLTFEQLYGTAEQKQSPCKHTWSKMMELLPKSIRPSVSDTEAPMEARQFVQCMGDVLRWIDDNCLTNSLVDRIKLDDVPFALVADVRRVQEVEAIKAMGGKVIYLTRELTDGDGHHTEHEFDSVDREALFDAIVDNRTCTIHEKNDEIYRIVKEWGWLQ
jgi:hypothetical protein